MKKAAGNLGTALVILLMVAAVLIYFAPHLGWRVDAVISGSMGPDLKVGSVVVICPVEPEAIAMGDIIAFHPMGVDETLISHRVIGIEEGSPLYFRTKGDANEDTDPSVVPAQNVVGKICFHIPFFGYIVQFLKSPTGFALALVIPGVIIIAMYVRSIRRALTRGKGNTS